MAKERKYTSSQLRWLAESLTNSQMAYLLEGDNAQLDNANKNAGLAEQPQNPGMSSVDNKGAMKPNVEQSQSQPKDDQSQIKTVCQAIKSGKLASIEPNQLNSFLKSAGITAKNVASAIKYAIEYLHAQMKNPAQIDMNALKGVISGVNNCMGALVQTKNAVAESVIAMSKTNGVDVESLVENVKQDNKFTIMKNGSRLNLNETLSHDINRMESLNEAICVCYSDILPEETKNILSDLNDKINESLENNSIENKIKEYYNLTVQIKNLSKLAESCDVDVKKFKTLQKMTKTVDKKLNEQMSALKFAINYYKENK